MSRRFTEEDARAVLQRNLRSGHWRYKVPPAVLDPTPPPAARTTTKRTKPALASMSLASQAIDRFVFQISAAGLPVPEREYHFAKPERRWRFDLAYPTRGLAVELEGVVRGESYQLGGRHVSVKGFMDDIEKYGHAFALGWSVLRIMHRQIDSGEALQLLERRLKLPTVWVPTS